jgi:hypothetical protein
MLGKERGLSSVRGSGGHSSSVCGDGFFGLLHGFKLLN